MADMRHQAAMLLIVAQGGLLLHQRDEELLREVSEETGLVIEDPVFLTAAVDTCGKGRAWRSSR